MIRRLARWVVLATAVPAVLLSFAYLSGDINTWWIELTHYVPFPVHLAPAMLALALSFTLRWPWRVAATCTVALVLTVIMGLAVGRSDAGSGRLRMMTYNVKAQQASERLGGFDRLAAEVATHRPDILVMQDAAELTPASREHMAQAFDHYAGRNVYLHGQYIVLTRYPLRDCKAVPLPWHERPLDYVHCIVTIDGQDVDLYTVHFISPRKGLNAARRERAEGIDDWQQNFNDRLGQSRRLAADLKARTSQRPMILAGDLNAVEPSPVIRELLATGLRDAYSSAGIGYGFSHGHALKPGFSFLRIDHILVSPDLGVVDAYPGGWRASEHRPVIADLLLQRTPR